MYLPIFFQFIQLVHWAFEHCKRLLFCSYFVYYFRKNCLQNKIFFALIHTLSVFIELKWAMRGYVVLFLEENIQYDDEERIEDVFNESISLSFSLSLWINCTSGRYFYFVRSLSIWVVTDQLQVSCKYWKKASLFMCLSLFVSKQLLVFIFVMSHFAILIVHEEKSAVVSIWCLFPKYSIRMNRLFMFGCIVSRTTGFYLFLSFADSFVLHFVIGPQW